MKKVVFDSSVIVKWFSDEEDSDKAAQILQEITTNHLTLVIPDVGLAEITNAIRYDKEYTQDECQKIINKLLLLEPIIIATKENIQTAIPLAYHFNIAIYDALYVAISHDYDLPLITADYKHHTKSMSKNILWLSTIHPKYLLD